MRVWLDSKLGDAIGDAAEQSKEESAGDLSCEAHFLPPDFAKELVLSEVRVWNQLLVIGFFRVGTGRTERVRACLLDMAELEKAIESAIESEEVVAIHDPTAMGGCAFDFSPDETQNEKPTVELLITAWGTHEEMATRIAEKLRLSTFRQGPPMRLER